MMTSICCCLSIYVFVDFFGKEISKMASIFG